ncbi:Transposon Ty3-I Gag-Pol polyprotein [Sesbania bispinosa]|nr:Transposon Ty3-I Gag-Pol polyprotein [Sesbania bispinosa]
MERAKSQAQDPLQDLGGPMTRARVKKGQLTLKQVVNSLLEAQHEQDSKSLNSKVINCLVQNEEHGEESSNGPTEGV